MAGNGDIEVVAGRWPGPVCPLAARPVLTRRVVWFARRRGRRPVAVLAAGAGRPSGGRWGHTVGAGLSAAAAVVGLGLLIASAEPPPAPAAAAGAADAPAEELFVVPSAPAVDFVVPVLPTGLPQLPAVDAGLTYPGLVPPVVPPPAARVPVAPGPAAPPLPTTSTTGATTTARAEGGAGTGQTGRTEGADTGTIPKPNPIPNPIPNPNPNPIPTCPAPAQPGPLVKALLLPGPLQAETLVSAGPATGPFPAVLPGVCLGLWSGGTGKPAVLVLGDRHAARVTFQDADPPPERSILVEHKDGSTRSYLLGDPMAPLPLTEAADLLTTTDAALVLVVSFNDGGTVTLVEAR